MISIRWLVVCSSPPLARRAPSGATAQAHMNLDNQDYRVGITVYRNGYTFADVEDDNISVIVMC